MRTLLFLAVLSSPLSAATFTVTRTDDPPPDGCLMADCSLREAIAAANATSEIDTIELPAGTYTLGRTGAGEDANASGDFDVSAPLIVRGAGRASTIINGADLDRLFDATAALTLERMTLRDGRAKDEFDVPKEGGAIRIAAHTLTLSDVRITSNEAGNAGGLWIDLGGSAFTNVEVDDNTALSVGGVQFIQSAAFQGTWNQVRVVGNRSTDPNGGGAGGAELGFAVGTINGLVVDNNETTGSVGGVSLGAAQQLTWIGGSISNNAARDSAGGFQIGVGRTASIDVRNVDIVGNLANRFNRPPVSFDQFRGGGGIVEIGCNDSCGIVSFINTRWIGNRVLQGVGGGLSVFGPAPFVEDSQFLRNEADQGGGAWGEFSGIEGQALTFSRTLFAANRAFIRGGAVAIGEQVDGNFTPASFSQNRITQNSAPIGGGFAVRGPLNLNRTSVYANSAEQRGGAIHAEGAAVALTNSTVSINAAPAADNLDLVDSDFTAEHSTLVAAPSRLGVAGSVLRAADSGAANMATFALSVVQGACDISVTTSVVATLGNREAPGNTCRFAGSSAAISLAQLALGPRLNNGGPTRTHLPATHSLVFQAAAQPNCPLADDQRGIERMVVPDIACDAGAVEITPSDVIFADDFEW